MLHAPKKLLWNDTRITRWCGLSGHAFRDRHIADCKGCSKNYPVCLGGGCVLSLIVLLLLSGCARSAAQPEESDLRLVSTAPNLTECVCAIGAGGLLVGRTESCDYPPDAVRHVPVIGGFGTPRPEPLPATPPTPGL